LGGILIDRVGTRKATLLFSFLCLCGAVVTASTSVFGVMGAGRMAFGLGAESLFVALATTVGRRFSSSELGFAFGISVGIGRLGSLAALNSPTWAPWAYATWRAPLLISAAASGVSVAAAGLCWALDEPIAHPAPDRDKGTRVNDALRAIRGFNGSYWLMVALFVAFSSAVFPFQTFAVKFFQQALGLTRQVGGILSSVVILSMIVGMPMLDRVARRMGNPGRLLVVGAALLVPAFACLAWDSVPPSLSLIVMGAVCALNAAVLWPGIRRIVDARDLGTAYGVMISVQNVGLVLVNVAVGGANDHWAASAANPGGYLPGIWIFAGMACVSLVLALRLSKSGALRRV
jgi:MFS family permease